MKFFRKTVIGLSAILLTTLTFTSSTYAWFKINSSASVEDIDISVTAGNGFVVSIDNINYANDLKSTELEKVMLVGYRPNQYTLHYDAIDKKSYVYLKVPKEEGGQYVYEKDPETNDFILDSNGEKIPVYVYDENTKIDEVKVRDLLKGIELLPLTSKDGVHMTDLFNSSATTSSGRYMEFSVYFRTLSQTPVVYTLATNTIFDDRTTYYEKNANDEFVEATNVTKANYKSYYYRDGYIYDIYLNGETENPFETNKKNSVKISPTKLVSSAHEINLKADMSCVIDGEVKTLSKKNDKITVYSSNAMRLSITDEKMRKETLEEETILGTNIYELNDSENGSKNLGSYATNYSVEYCTNNGIEYNFNDLGCLYDSSCSASYTYYNNLKSGNPLDSKRLEYSAIPTTIKDLTSKDNDGNYIYNKKITTLSSGEDGKKITFRFWLEGWDADCFDGLEKAVTTSLSFISKRIY